MSGVFAFAGVESGDAFDVEDVKPLCCLGCLAVSRPLRPLERATAALYGELVGTAVSQSDVYPTFLCNYCRALLLKYKGFRDKCRSVQHTFLGLLSSGVPLTHEFLKSCETGPPFPNLQSKLIHNESYIPVGICIEDTFINNQHNIKTENFINATDENGPTSSLNRNQNEGVLVIVDDLKPEVPISIDYDYQEPDNHDSDSNDENDIPISDIRNLLAEKRKAELDKKDFKLRDGVIKKSNIKQKPIQKKKTEKRSKSSKKVAEKRIKKSRKITNDFAKDTTTCTDIENPNKSKLDIYFERRRANSEKKFNVKYVYLSKEEQIRQVEARKLSVNYKLAIYKCDICYRGFRMELAYKNHMILHDPSYGDEVCDVCRMRFPTKRELAHHKYLTHRYDLVCNECGHITKTSCNAALHYRKHRGVKYPCKICGKFFDKPNRVWDHMNVAHEGALACSICDEKFIGRNGLRVHMFRAHKEAKGAVCSDCGVQFHSHTALRRHRPQGVGCDPTNRPCAVCGESFTSEQLLQQHKREHHVKNGYKCTVCDKVLHSKTKYRNHVNNHITQNKTRWVEGAAAGEGDGAGAEGPRLERVQQVFMCEMCGFSVKNSKQALEKHRRTHTGEKLFQCEICHKRFTTKRYLGIHTGKHMGIKPPTKTYLCRFCEKPFNHQGNRDKHEKGVHQKLRPFECGICDKTFQSKDAMQNHVNHTHQGVPWPKRVRRRDPKPPH